jgi:hypothetical protein
MYLFTGSCNDTLSRSKERGKKKLFPVQLFGLRGVQVTGFSYLSFEMKQEQSSEGHAVSSKLRIDDAF